MNRRRFVLTTTSTAIAALALAACGDKAPGASAAAPAPAPSSQKPSAQEAYEMAARGSGFAVGPVMAANTVYVFFDPTCPHCAALWTNSKALSTKLKMVWIPIGWLQRSSQPQAATILSASDPAAAMAENEASVLQRGGGITVSSSLSDEVVAKVKANTELFHKLGEESVPLIVFKNGRTGQFGTFAGAVPAEQLAAMVGV
ncbi:MAG TPA: thioredoxin fold domain-containing protein [Albitalea sp.]|uniref:thioredoxin fold domain-containing protein n=1 Tax=Piscinibacter sp. TaxID=1903157 RepID=UPI002ED5EB12